MTPNPRIPTMILTFAATTTTLCADPASTSPKETTPKETTTKTPSQLDTTLRLVPIAPDDPHDPLLTITGSDAEPLLKAIQFDTSFRPAFSTLIGIIQNDPAFVRLDPLGPVKNNRDFNMQFDRATELIDGGFRNTPPAEDASASFFESPGERFDRYSLDLEWVPAGAGNQFQWLVLGGIQAVRADIRRLDDAHLSIIKARGTVAIPTIGTGVRWKPTDFIEFSTTASTQSIDQNAGVVDITLSAQLQLSRLIDLTAGYEFYRSDMVIENLRTSLGREGVFAKLTIRF